MKTIKYLLSIAGTAMIVFSSCKKDATQAPQRIDASQSEDVTFVYNGDSVTYGSIISPTTGRRWLNRNLGAIRVAKSYNDYQAYGDLFQCGRPADGHQLINWTSSTTGTFPNGTTTTLATTDKPGHSLFILAPNVSPWAVDWRDNNNANRWNTNSRGPCPKGWHVPTNDEWKAEFSNQHGGTAISGGITDRNTAYSLLKLTVSGIRKGLDDGTGGQLGTSSAAPGNIGRYWSSTDHYSAFDGYHDNYSVNFDGIGAFAGNLEFKATGCPVRCIKN